MLRSMLTQQRFDDWGPLSILGPEANDLKPVVPLQFPPIWLVQMKYR